MKFVPIHSHIRGFTLLEMLVALVIMAVTVASASLALRPDDGRQLASEAERLALLLAQAREESELGGMRLAWVAAEDHYEFERREMTGNGPSWSVLRGDDLLHPRRLPVGFTIRRIEADGRQLAYGERLNLDPLGVRWVKIELSMGEARTLIRSVEEGFEVTPLARSDS